MIKRFAPLALAALTGLAGLGFASPAIAKTYEERIDDHVALVGALIVNGVEFEVNPEECDGTYSGYYNGQHRVLVVCQDNSYGGGPTVTWTENDLDTIRHEAAHFTQDCLVGGDHDGRLENLLPARDSIQQLGERVALTIAKTYSEAGYGRKDIELEFEAFAMAGLDNPLLQVEAINKFCDGY